MKANPILDQLKAKGFRRSKLREVLLDIFLKTQEPLSVKNLQEALKARGLLPNKTSVYRQLEILLEQGTLQSLVVDSQAQLFELKRGHHHHFVCRQCEKILDFVDDKLESAFATLMKRMQGRGLQVSHHEFNLFGRCSACS